MMSTSPVVMASWAGGAEDASNGGADTHPDWYRNLEANPDVEIQVEDRVLAGTARTAAGGVRSRLWATMAGIWPEYDRYTTRTDREIPVVVITPRSSGPGA